MDKVAVKKFVKTWCGRGYEKGESQPFWLALLRDVLEVERPEEFIIFEEQVHLDHTSFIDGYIPATKVLIEQKSLGKDLQRPIKQSDGTYLTPFQQAKRYILELPVDKHPRWVVVSNFAEFHVYDMNKPQSEPEHILLKDLERDYYRLNFLVNVGDEHVKREMEISLSAGKLVSLLYDELLKQYHNPQDPQTLRSLNILCVRLVFCFYADDAELFGRKFMFCDYLKQFPALHMRKALVDLFEVLNTKIEERDPYLLPDLAAFPYVNGGLFAQKDVEIPIFTEEIRDLILEKASLDLDWSQISPTIFGAVFESTLNPVTRRKGGMHYTSIENIHKVIDPLFLNDLKEELAEIKALKTIGTRKNRLKKFQEKLSNLTFLDPACGSGNFLTETYLSLRRLENEVLETLNQSQMEFSTEEIAPIQVRINQFYGIEINDFAVTVAKTALWIAESQMLKETEEIIKFHLDFLPLRSYANIIEGNALRLNWNDIIEADKLSYIMGNPPFVGYSLQSKEQKNDLTFVYDNNLKGIGKLDYVSCWYKKAADYMQSTDIRAAFVSTNSITQGEQVAILWKPLFAQGIKFNFAYKTFKWDSESTEKAAVYCVIIGFSYVTDIKKYLYDNGNFKIVECINAYLIDGFNIFVESRNNPLCNVPKMITGNRPADGGHLIIEEEDYENFVKTEPRALKYIKKLVGSEEFINRRRRYCLWLVDASPSEISQMPKVKKRVEACQESRLNGAPDRQKLALKPAIFRETKNPTRYVLIPATSSERRKYIPIVFFDENTIATNSAIICPDATLYHFGILTSNVHMAWMRAFAGRLKSDYRYSINIVYNNFPWPNPTPEQKAKIERTAQAILEARAKYPDSSLADLYDDVTMPPELRKAHQNNDRAVMEAYGLPIKETTESSCVARLMELYKQLTIGN